MLLLFMNRLNLSVAGHWCHFYCFWDELVQIHKLRKYHSRTFLLKNVSSFCPATAHIYSAYNITVFTILSAKILASYYVLITEVLNNFSLMSILTIRLTVKADTILYTTTKYMGESSTFPKSWTFEILIKKLAVCHQNIEIFQVSLDQLYL